MKRELERTRRLNPRESARVLKRSRMSRNKGAGFIPGSRADKRKIKRKRVNEKEEPLLLQLVDLSTCQTRLRETVFRVVCFINGRGNRASSTVSFCPSEFTEFGPVVSQSRKHRLPSRLFQLFKYDLIYTRRRWGGGGRNFVP